MNDKNIRVGIIGSGFISLNLVNAFPRVSGFEASCILTRRPPAQLLHFPPHIPVTGSVQELMDRSDVIVECCGDVPYATQLIDTLLRAGMPVVTLDAQLHITTGSYFAGKGLFTEAEGDQPGSLAALHREVTDMGFTPLVYGSFKGFLNPDPSREDMEYWSAKQGISFSNVISFTDGTKLHIEQALVANGLGADMLPMLGPKEDDLKTGAALLAAAAERNGAPVSDYILSPKHPHGVFIVATHDERQKDVLQYLKMGDGPYYTILKNNIFAHLEVFRTIRQLLETKKPLLDNSTSPKYSVGAIAKTSLQPGDKITCGMGSLETRGEALRMADHPDHVPIGLLYDAVITRSIRRGELLTFRDVDLPDSLALDIWSKLMHVAGQPVF